MGFVFSRMAEPIPGTAVAASTLRRDAARSLGRYKDSSPFGYPVAPKNLQLSRLSGRLGCSLDYGTTSVLMMAIVK